MKLNRALLTNGISKTFEDDVDFSSTKFDPTHIKSIPNCHVVITATDFETILHIDLKIEATVIGVCSYSLEDVELKLNINDSIDITDDEEDVDNYFEKDVIIDLDPYILGILLANIPVKIVKKGAKLPQNGSGYRVINEEDYLKEKEKETDPRWAKLDSVKIFDD